jgi:hypothetical protein
MPNPAQEEGLSLLNSIVDQAKMFITAMGSFHPFGAVVKHNGDVSPYALADDAGWEDTHAYLHKLLDLLDLDASEGRYRAYAVGVDVVAQLPGRTGKCDAVQIRLRHPELDPVDYYMAYTRGSQAYIFYELVTIE